MDRLKYYRTKLGYEGTNSQQDQERQQRAMREFERQQIESRRKEEAEERRRQQEERRKREERDTYTQSLKEYTDLWKDPQPITGETMGESRNTIGENTHPSQFNIPSGSSMLRSVNQRDEYISPYLEYGNNLTKDLNDSIATQKALGRNEREIQESLIPPENNTIQERLNEIAEKIKSGKEGFIYGFQEGYLERELQDMLSKENVRKINGLSNNVDLIEKFFQDNPEIQRTERDSTIGEWLSKGIRGAGSQTKQRVDSYQHALKQPSTYAWAGAITAASIMAAPFTGGASLAGGGALLVTSPLVAGGMSTASKAIAMLGPVAGARLGLMSGSYDNMAKLEGRSSYVELIDAGVDKKIAEPLAETIGAVNGLIELLQIETAFSVIPGVEDLAGKAKDLALKEGIKRGLKVLGGYGINLGSEVLEEAAQAGVSELGLELGKYLQDAPDPSTIEGLGVLAKTMTSADFRDTVLNEGYEALQSMWLTPILSSAGRVTANQALMGVSNQVQANQVGRVLEQEDNIQRNSIKKSMDYILEKDGATDQAIRMVNETLDTGAIGFLMSEKQILQDMMQREDVTNQDKAKIESTLDKVNNVLSKTMYDVKEENADIEYKPTNLVDVEADILSDGFLEDNEIYNDRLSNYNIELYKSAQNYNIVDTIKEELTKGTNKAEIINKITKSFPRKERRPVNVMSVINSVELVQNEAKAQIVMNNLYNLSEVHNHTADKIVTQENITQENLQNNTNDETLVDDLKEDTNVDDAEVLVEDKNITTEVDMPINEFQEDTTHTESTTEIEIEPDLVKDEESIAESTFNPADVKKVPIAKINIDPDRFQFRYDRGNQGGATKKLVGAEYNPMLAGSVLLWEDEYNDLYVVNGHHRVDLAKNSDVSDIDARIISHSEYSADEARALGAMINIAEDNATSIDVAKLIRDTGITEDDFNEVGVRPSSKIAKDGMALSKLNDWIFTQVATRAIPIERAVIIGNDLGDNPDGQNQIIKAVDSMEVKGKSITNDILTELIAEVKGTARDEFTEMTLFGEETFTKNYSLERAELVSYVKGQLKSRVNLLKNVSKNKNAAILKELGNTIAVDDNVKEMNTADQALFILDKTLNYKGTKVNELFNNLAREYADADNKASVKKKALNELISLMEGGNVFEAINQEVKREGIKDSIRNNGRDGERGQASYGLSESELENQVNLFGEETMMQLKSLAETKIIANEDVKDTTAFRATAAIVEAIKNNPIFNGLTIEYSNKSGKVTMSKQELIKHGYGHLEETGDKYIYGFYNDGNRTITLNREATRDTILEEVIHDIQHRLEEIDPSLAVLVNEWESEVREQALKEGIAIPEGYELLAQALVYTEFGYASTNPFIANLISVDNEIVDKFKILLGEDIAERGFGFVESEISRENRLLRGKYEDHANRIFNSKYIDKAMDAESSRKAEIVSELENSRAVKYYQPYTSQYAIAHPSTKGSNYQITYFDPEFGPVSDSQYETTQEVADRLVEDGYFYKTDEIHYQLKNYDRSMADELYTRLHLQRGPGTDIDTTSDRGNVSVPINGTDIVRIREAILTGNFTEADYEQLIKNNTNLVNHDKQVLLKHIKDSEKKGLNRPNKEVTFKQFINRFYDYDIESDNDMSEYDVKKLFLYNIDSTIEKKGYLEKAKQEGWTDEYLAELVSKEKSIADIKTRLKDQHKYFQDKTETYRHRGLQYQLKEGLINKENISSILTMDVSDAEKKNKIANLKNYKTNIGRVIATDYELDIEEGQLWDNRGVATSWTDRNADGVEFKPEGGGDIEYVLQVEGEVEGYRVQYFPKGETDELDELAFDETYEKLMDLLGSDGDMSSEAEILLPAETKLRIKEINDGREDMGYIEIILEEINPSYQLKAATDTPEFKNWFKDSKVVDENGEPLIVYHGTADKVFDTFDISKTDYQSLYGRGFYFTDNSNIADEYVKKNKKGYVREGNEIKKIEQQPGVFEVYLSIQNPFNIDEHIMTDEEISEIFLPHMYGDLDYARELGEVNDRNFIKIMKDMRNEHDWQYIIPSVRSNMRETLIELGYDGITHFGGGIMGDETHKVNIAFHPTQIKSIYNNGMFNEYDPNINYQLKESINNVDHYELEYGSSIYNNFIKDGIETNVVYKSEEQNGLSTLLVDSTVEDKEIHDMVIRDAVLDGYDYLKMGDNEPTLITNQMIEEVMTQGQPIFQLKEESNGSLLAMHNISVANLKNAIKLGGFPMPSIAITKKDIPFTDFGEISLLFNKDAIDPSNEFNKVFSGDAWTPVFPHNAAGATMDEILNMMLDRPTIRNAENAMGTKGFLVDNMKEYSSINEIQDDSDRLQNSVIAQEANSSFYRDFNYLVDRIDFYNKGVKSRAGWSAEYGEEQNNIINALKDVANEYKHKDLTNADESTKIETVRRVLVDSGYNMANQDKYLLEISQLIENALKMPVDMFEAKPQRAVTFDEVQAAMINTTDLSPGEIKQAKELLSSVGIRVVEEYNNNNIIGWRKFGDDNYNLNIVDQDNELTYNETGISLKVIESVVGKDIAEQIKNSTKDWDSIKVDSRQQAMDNILRQNDVSFQIKETDTSTPEFKNWFKNSKVVDEKGSPLKVYHGTPNEFDTFDYKYLGTTGTVLGYGFYFAKDKDIAGMYIGESGNVMETYLKIEKPLNHDKTTLTKAKLRKFIKAIDPDGFELLSDYGDVDYDGYDNVLSIAIDQLMDYNENDVDIISDMINSGGFELKEYYETLFNALGHDGIIVDHEGMGTVYIPFLPNQIKSVYNQGTWDANDPNIYYQMKEEPSMEERSWGQTVRDANITNEELRDLLTSNKFMYDVKHNEDTMIAAAKLIDKKGEEYIEARLLSDISNDTLLMAASQILTYKYLENGEQDRAMALLDKTAEKATSLGQAIQILSVWGRQTPEGMLRYTTKRFKDAMTDRDKQLVADKTKALVDEFNRLNKQAIHEVDLVGTIEQVQEMTPVERATRDAIDKGTTVPDGGFTPDMLKAFENNIDDDMIQRITDTVNQHYQDGTGNLKDKLIKLGLNDFESEILNKYIKQKIKDSTKGSKQATIDKELSKKGYQRQGIDEQILDLASEGKIDETTLRNLVGEKEGMPVLNKELVEYIYNQGQLINSLPEGRQRDVETAKLMKAISDQMPVSFWRKVSTFQTMAQLLNFKTTIRNLVGNDMFRRLDTFTLNFLGTPIDAALAKINNTDRTMLFRPIKANQEQKLGYKEGWRLGLEDALLGINTSDEATQYDLRPTRTFKTGPLNKLETLMDIALRATDRAAVMATFRDSLAEQMELAGVDTPTDEMAENAMMVGLYRTFQDDTVLSEAFSGMKRAMNRIGSKDGAFGLGELVLKYPKTPANILSRAIDYSPAGVAVTMLKLRRDTSPKGSYLRQRMVAEGLSRAVMGTGLIATGAILARMGVLTGGNPDDDEDIYKLEKQYGLRDFSVNVSAIGRHFTSGFTDAKAGELRKGDIIASYDWAEPIAMGLAIGADTELGSGEALDFLSTVVRATEAGATTLADQPLLTGLSNLFRGGDVVSGTANIIRQMPASFTPTLFSHVAQFLDGRDTDPYSFYSEGRQAWNLVQNRVPGLRGNIPSRISVLGEERRYYPEDMNLVLRALNIFLNPSITNKYMPSEEAELIFDLYKASGNPEIVPRAPQRSYTFDGEKITPTPEQWQEWSKWLGETTKSEIGRAMETYARGWSAEEQAEEIEWIIDNVRDRLRERIEEDKLRGE